ncbi:GroES-like protein [Schizopora paradoxa]|uniref:GroES-like protein n=1 Tax=Schizopora paradoxa TaxID=27342 RepID=A0A0H2RLJ8_9AGAM|nr:GroES-like protein [Schizopora paradoxa]
MTSTIFDQLQKALYIDSPGGDFVLKSKDIPKPCPGEILVQIRATALNQDWKVKKYKPAFITHYPFLLGGDVAGVVEEVGEGVTEFKKGDRVIHEGSWSDRHASYQQYAVAAAEHVAKLPENVSFEEAASIPLALATAVISLYSDCDRPEGVKKLQPPPWEAGGGGAYKGETILVLGGSSSVGQFAIQMLKLSGFSKIIATASLHNTDLLKSLGATHIIDRNADLVSEVRKLLDGKNLNLIYDTVGTPEIQTQAVELLAPGGQFIAAALVSIDAAKFPDKHFVTLYADFRLPQHWALGKSLAGSLHDLLASGTIKPNPIEVLPNGLAGVVGGLQRLERGEVSGKKLIVRPQETP